MCRSIEELLDEQIEARQWELNAIREQLVRQTQREIVTHCDCDECMGRAA